MHLDAFLSPNILDLSLYFLANFLILSIGKTNLQFYCKTYCELVFHASVHILNQGQTYYRSLI